MKWIKAEVDNLPTKRVVARGKVEIFGTNLFLWNPDSVRPEHFDWEWLDESELSFGLSDMRGLFNHFNNCFVRIAGVRFGDQLFIEYFKDKFNINI